MKSLTVDAYLELVKERYFLPPANEVWGKVIFSEACVKNSVHRAGWGWYPSMHCR